MNQPTSSVAIPLGKTKKRLVFLGCIFIMLSVAMFGLALATLQAPILTRMDAMSYFSLLTIFASLGLSIMTPIGGKLGDLLGRRNVIIVAGSICALSGIGLGLVRSILPFMFLRLILGAAQGAFLAAPYILAREINEPKDVPKAMGLLSSSIAVGGLVGSIIGGILTDMGLLNIAIMFPALPLLIGVILIALNLPNIRRSEKVTIDVPGILTLAVTLTGILLALNYGPRIGWTDPGVLIGFAVGIAALMLLIRIEKRSAEPILPMRLFANRKYTLYLAIGFITYFYFSAMNTYAPLAVIKVLGGSTAVTGSLQLPRTVITILLPALAGAWVGRRQSNSWKAMAIATSLVVLAFLTLALSTNPGTSVTIFFVALGITGIAESFRAVSITPAAQSTLDQKDLGIGTSLVTFINSLSSLIAAAVYGIAYDLKTKADPVNVANISAGVGSVFLIAAVVTMIGLVLVLVFVRRTQVEPKLNLSTNLNGNQVAE